MDWGFTPGPAIPDAPYLDGMMDVRVGKIYWRHHQYTHMFVGLLLHDDSCHAEWTYATKAATRGGLTLGRCPLQDYLRPLVGRPV